MNEDKHGLSRRALLGAGFILPVGFVQGAEAQPMAQLAYNDELYQEQPEPQPQQPEPEQPPQQGATPAGSAYEQLQNMTNGSESLNQGFFGGGGGPDDVTVIANPQVPEVPEPTPTEPPPPEPEPASEPEPESEPPPPPTNAESDEEYQQLSSQYDDAVAEAAAAAAVAAAAFAAWEAVRSNPSTPPEQYNQTYQEYQQAQSAQTWQNYKVQRVKAAMESRKRVIYVLDATPSGVSK